MTNVNILWCVVFAAGIASGHRQCHGQSAGTSKQPVTVTPSGEIRGSYNVTRKGRQFESYRGIRYAEPPVGELRFQPPKFIVQYASPVDASKEGPACPQPAPEGYYIDEDCLRLNVYTPLKHTRSELLPVVVFIHAGGFYSMSGRSDLAGPHYLLDRDVVLVTMNYRLASLGFLSTGDKFAPGNNGFKDQVMALRWVQKNIAAFGGDPGSVTVAGCSAGSISALLHMISPMSTGLFHRAISISGSPLNIVPTPPHQRNLAIKQANLLNCPSDTSKNIIDCLKTKTWKQLGDSLGGFAEFGYDPILIWSPVIEKDYGQEIFLAVDPVVAIKKGKIQAVPYIISQTQDEFFWKAFTVLRNETLNRKMNEEWDRVAPIAFMLPRENNAEAVKRLRQFYLHDKLIDNDTASADNLGELYADSIMGFPVYRSVKLMSKYSRQPVWHYEFAYLGNHSHYEDPVTGKPTKVAHHDDLIYLFTLGYRFPDIGLEGQDATLVDRMTAIWYNFARYGDPNPRRDTPELAGLEWPTCRPEDRKYLRIDDNFSVHKNLFEDRFRFWDELYPI